MKQFRAFKTRRLGQKTATPSNVSSLLLLMSRYCKFGSFNRASDNLGILFDTHESLITAGSVDLRRGNVARLYRSIMRESWFARRSSAVLSKKIDVPSEKSLILLAGACRGEEFSMAIRPAADVSAGRLSLQADPGRISSLEYIFDLLSGMNAHKKTTMWHEPRRSSALLSSRESAETVTACYRQIDLHTMILTETTLEDILIATQMSSSYYSKLLSVSSYITKCSHGLLIFVPGIRLIVTTKYAYVLHEEKGSLLPPQTNRWYDELHSILKDLVDAHDRQYDTSLDKALTNLLSINSISTTSSPEVVVVSAVVELLCKWNAEEYTANKDQFSNARDDNNLILMQMALQQHEQHISRLDNILYCIDYFINQKFFPSRENDESLSVLGNITDFLKFLSRSLCTLKYQIAEHTEYSNLYLSNYRDTLDRKRNKLIKIQLHITYVSLGIGFISLISGIFGINLMNFANYPDEPPLPYLQWSQMGSFKSMTLYTICLVSFGIFSVVVGMLTWYTRAKLDYEDRRK